MNSTYTPTAAPSSDTTTSHLHKAASEALENVSFEINYRGSLAAEILSNPQLKEDRSWHTLMANSPDAGRLEFISLRSIEKQIDQLRHEGEQLSWSEKYDESLQKLAEAARLSQAIALHCADEKVRERAPRCDLDAARLNADRLVEEEWKVDRHRADGPEKVIEREERKLSEEVSEDQEPQSAPSKKQNILQRAIGTVAEAFRLNRKEATKDSKAENREHEPSIFHAALEKLWHPTSSFAFVGWTEQSTKWLAEKVREVLIPGINAELLGGAAGVLALYISREAYSHLHKDKQEPHAHGTAAVKEHWKKLHEAFLTFAGHVTAGFLLANAASFVLVPVVGHAAIVYAVADGVGRWLFHVAEDYLKDEHCIQPRWQSQKAANVRP